MELTVDQMIQQGVAAHNQGNLQEAERLYRAILQLVPTHPDASHNLGLLAVAVNNIEFALPLFKTAIEQNPKIEQFWLSYIDALTRENEFKHAKRVIKKAKKAGFVGKKLKAAEGRLLRSPQGQVNQPSVEVAFPSEAQINSLRVSYQNGHYGDAENLARLITQQFPEYQFSWKVLGALLGQAGRHSEAIIVNEKSVKLAPQDAEAHSNLGNTLKELGRFEQSESSYRQAIALKPDLDEVRYNLGVLLFETKQYSNAKEQFELIDIHDSRSYAIRCSYLQDEETIFYQKLERLINQGQVNAVIGSLICCSEIKYGIKKLNPFCNKPLNYVLNTNLSGLYDFEDIFVSTAIDVLTDGPMSHKVQTLLTNGTQTAGNIFSLDQVLGTEIESIIRVEIEKYRMHFVESEEGFIKKWPTSYNLFGWLVCMQSGGKLDSHMHDSGWISGSIYINVPPKSKPDSGNLVVCSSDAEQFPGIKAGQESIIEVSTGSLCLFPSSLHHYTIPFEQKENRIVLAFDVVPIK
jgi:Flp pilus assembly protein TadD